MLNTVIASLPKRLIVLAALCACPLVQAQMAPSRIGYVATERLYSDSKLAKIADAKIVAEFTKRQKNIDDTAARWKALSQKYEADAPALGEPERTRRTRELIDLESEVQRMNREFREDLLQRKNEERAIIGQKAYKVIEQIAEQEHLDIVVQEVAWFSARIDITDKILKQLDK
ncbi:MAG: OmpH family outer membrane protein [Pseudomonadota bacterium]